MTAAAKQRTRKHARLSADVVDAVEDFTARAREAIAAHHAIVKDSASTTDKMHESAYGLIGQLDFLTRAIAAAVKHDDRYAWSHEERTS